MRVQMLAQLLDAVATYPQLDRPGCEPTALHADKDGLAVAGHLWANLEPAAQGLSRHPADRDHAGAVALTVDSNLALAQIKLRQIQTGQLGQPQAG